ncbi:uncharacterized protein LOC141590385 [Silene latifolia]|uniref:uncharacterized protein LOC141590385 n=1 Tax=Silene latifolia TaxID=37657 RepID=UPI003D776B61
MVFILSGELVSYGKLYKGVFMVIGQVDLPVNLLKFPVDGFEMIVRMDWLGMNKAKLDCHQKKVSLIGSKGASVSYRGFVVKPKVKVIAEVTLKSYLRNGGPLILCHVKDTRMVEPTTGEIPVVGEFPDVFPDEIPVLPPKREIDFSVELKPGTGPISKAPYRMGPKELEDLKKQLNYLVDKGGVAVDPRTIEAMSN